MSSKIFLSEKDIYINLLCSQVLGLWHFPCNLLAGWQLPSCCVSTPGSWPLGCRCRSFLVGHSPYPSWQSPARRRSSCTLSPRVRHCHLYTSPVCPRCTQHKTCFGWGPHHCLLYTAVSESVGLSAAAGGVRWARFHSSCPSRSPCVGWPPTAHVLPEDA